jgi:hypothetical protein
MEEYKLHLNEAGEVSYEKELSDHERESKMELIYNMIDDPNCPPGEIKRKIAGEIATVNRLMIKYGNDVSILEGLKIKALSEQVKALRELGKEVMEADVMSKKDFLNWEGKKFRYAIDEFMDGAKQAMKTVKLDESTINSVLNHWRDIMQSKEAEIKRNLDKLDSAK